MKREKRRVAITGARGLVGACLAHYLGDDHDVHALAHTDLDVTDHDTVRDWCLRNRPDLIVNCATLQVDASELDPPLAEAVNVTGPENLALAAADVGAELMHFSTNYVFDGESERLTPYTIADETRPINVYGRTKLAGERAVTNATPASYVVRTAWVYGVGKESFLASVPRKLLASERVFAIVDAFSTTTYVRDLVVRAAEIIERRRYGTYHVVNEGVCSYYEFAVQAARLIGLEGTVVDELIVPVKESDMKRPARRPRWTPLRCVLSAEIGLAPLRDWREALASYISTDLGGRRQR
jgi:dTDP-4-dehydrorhamnose reductase